jgi:hypothetical protein
MGAPARPAGGLDVWIRQVGWLLVFIGLVSEVVYHGPQILLGYQWPEAIATFGEFGHTVVFVGIVALIYAYLRSHQSKQP